MADKIVIAVWDDRAPAALRAVLLDRLAPALAPHTVALSVIVRDEHAASTRSPTPFPLFGRNPVALVNAWTDGPPAPILETVREIGLEHWAWRVDESVPTDYGDNPHAQPRAWPDGERSPGLTLVTFMERPRRLDRAEWIRRWHGRMSPVSEAIQPRQRYVRNLLVEALTPGAPPFEGIVEEVWADAGTISSPFRFYGAGNPVRLVRNAGAILLAVMSFLTLWRVRTVVMSEWFVRTPSTIDP